MSPVLPPGVAWDEQLTRLRVGIVPVDALGRPGPLGGLAMHLEQVPRPHQPAPATVGAGPHDGIGLPGIVASPSGRFPLSFGDPAHDGRAELVVRIVSRDRRYVPRRLTIPAPGEQAVIDAEHAHELPPFPAVPLRSRRPVLFPGAAYGVWAAATVIRGRVIRPDGTPVRWARVAARTIAVIQVHHPDDTVTAEQPSLGHAHGDDRGEFVLFVGSLPIELMPKEQTVGVQVRVSARLSPPVDSPTMSEEDPLWDLPIENLADVAGSDDPVARGVADPPGFTAVVTRDIVCRRGRTTSPSVPFVLP